MTYNYNYNDKKIVAVIASNLEFGVALNVIGHLSISIGSNVDSNELMGQQNILDASGGNHLGIAKYPLIITKVKPGKIKKLISKIKKEHPNIIIADYPEQMLHTAHDKELIAELSNQTEDKLIYLGVIIYGDSEEINTLTGRYSLWR